MTGFSRTTVARIFQDEKGVIVLERPERMHKRKYRSVRIPRAVYERVIRRLSVRSSGLLSLWSDMLETRPPCRRVCQD